MGGGETENDGEAGDGQEEDGDPQCPRRVAPFIIHHADQRR